MREKFVEVDKKWKTDRGDQNAGKGALGSKHLRLAIVLMETAYSDPMLSDDGRKKIADGFGGVNLDGDQLNSKATIMQWRTFKGDKDGALEFSLAHDVRGVEVELVKLLTTNGGKEKHGTEPRGPGIRKIDEMIDDTWKKVIQQDRAAVEEL